jgi:hypothetical protein
MYGIAALHRKAAHKALRDVFGVFIMLATFGKINSSCYT